MPPLRNELYQTIDGLKKTKRWVLWRYVPPKEPGGKPGKMPICVHTGRAAKSTDPTTWATFNEAESMLKAGGFDGLMYALKESDGLVFIDLDGCRNPKNKTIHAWAKPIVERIASYTEISPSDTGLHILCRGKKPGGGCKVGRVEMYADRRFVCMSFRKLTNAPDRFETRQAQIDQLYEEVFRKKGRGTVPPCRAQKTVPEEPDVVIDPDKLAALLNNKLARAIYEGKAGKRYKSQSEADLALMGFAVQHSWSKAECTKLVQTARANAKAEEKHELYYELTYTKACGDFEPVTLPEARAVFQKRMLLPDPSIVDAILAVVASAHLPGDPVWLHFVGPPSTGKTEIVNAVSKWPSVYPLSELTPAGLVSGINTPDGKDHSLLPRLHHRTMVIKDFTPALELPRDQRARLFSRLRDGYDGSQAVHTAMVGTRRHKARFNFASCVTNAVEKLGRNTSMGERFLMFRHIAPDPIKAGRKALESAPIKERMREELEHAACGVLVGIDLDVVPACPKHVQDALLDAATMLARARTFVDRDHFHRVVGEAETEGATRIVQQLLKFGQGLAIINRRKAVNESDLKLLRRVAADSIPSVRRKLIGILASARGELESTEIESRMQRSHASTYEELEDLVLIGVATKRVTGQTNHYQLAKAFRGWAKDIHFGPPRPGALFMGTAR